VVDTRVGFLGYVPYISLPLRLLLPPRKKATADLGAKLKDRMGRPGSLGEVR